MTCSPPRPSKLALVQLPHPARVLAASAALAAACLAATGCAAFDRAFGKQELVVQFRPNTPRAAILQVRAACSHMAGTFAEPIPKHALAIQLPDDVRYEVSNASDAQQARLEQCLSRFPSVAGVEPVSPSGD